MNCNMKLKWKFSFECVATTVSCFSVQEPKIVTSSVGHQGGTSARLSSLCTVLCPFVPYAFPFASVLECHAFSFWILIYSLRLYGSVSVKLPDCSDHSELLVTYIWGNKHESQVPSQWTGSRGLAVCGRSHTAPQARSGLAGMVQPGCPVIALSQRWCTVLLMVS